MKTLIIFALLGAIPLTSFAKKEERILGENEKSRINNILNELIQTSHPSLQKRGLSLKLHTIANPAYFFESNFGASRALLGKKKYKVGVNPIVFDHDISDHALKGVLAHELVHTEDYASGNTFNTLIPIGLAVLGKKTKIQYERKTDLKVIVKGLHGELKAYKLWQYPLLNPSDLVVKKREYLTPEEIDRIVLLKEKHPEILKGWLDYKIPLDMDGIEMSIRSKERKFDNHEFKSKLTNHNIKRSKNKRFTLQLKLFDGELDSCKLKAYPFTGRGHDFTQERTFKVKHLSRDHDPIFNLRFTKKMKGVDFLLKDCKGTNRKFFFQGNPELSP